jgi:arylsulfatase A-like enzyme
MRALSSLLTATLLLPVAPLLGAAGTKPNIVFILADDLGYGELGSYGQTLIATPQLDQLAAAGMRFTQFYAGSTVCAPARSVLMTGLHMGHTTVRGNSAANRYAGQTLRAEDVTVADVLQRAGYATGLIGKWGLGEADSEGAPWKQGFDYFYGFLNQTHAHNHFPDHLWRNQERVPLKNDLVPVGTVPGVGYATQPRQYATDLFFEEAETFISRHQGRPFFLYLALTVPHANNERSRMLGDGQEVPDYGAYADRDWSDATKGQAAMISRMDTAVGRLMRHLRALGLEDNTIVIFTSDNGPHREGGPHYDPAFFNSSGGLRGLKRDLTEGGIRVPFLVRWPGVVAAGSLSHHVGYFGDVLVTFGELAGAEVPVKHDGRSLVPVLRGEPAAVRPHEYLYWEFYERAFVQAVLLEGRWKGIRRATGEPEFELYDLRHDLAESRNLAGAEPDRVRQLGQLMDTAHVPNAHWRRPEPAR